MTDKLAGWKGRLFDFLIAPANIWMWAVSLLFGLNFQCGRGDERMPGLENSDGREP